MFTVTDAAQTEVAEYFRDHDKGAIRVFLHEGGCGGPQLAMAVDTKQDTDQIFEFSGVEYLVEKELLEKALPIEIDYAVNGFKISSSLKFEGGGCSGCGSSGACCS